MENKIVVDLVELVKHHENICSNLIGGWEYKRLVAELRELLDKHGYIIEPDKECLECWRYYSGSCKGSKDRGREEITNENCCSGFLKVSKAN